ncbi:MAG: ECF transporter S component [Bacilli bacterium]|nr:ECF transporter S component [Bacilli bacterium]
MRNKMILKIVLSGAFIAIGWVLPFLTGQIPEFGNMLLPMHLPVFIAGFMLGPIYGCIVGLVTPITRSLIFGMPKLFPGAVGMMFELAAYGFICGLIFNVILKNFRKNKGQLLATTYISLVVAMLGGRIIWGLARMAFTLIPEQSFTYAAFISGAFVTAWPGILIQLVLIPAIIFALNKQMIIDFEVDARDEIEQENL